MMDFDINAIFDTEDMPENNDYTLVFEPFYDVIYDKDGNEVSRYYVGD